MIVQDYLKKHRRKIICVTGCGRCCTNQCTYKDIPNGLCCAHPSIIGKRLAKAIRDPACDQDPYFIVTRLGIVCPPVANAIERLTGIRPPANRRPRRDGVFYFQPAALLELLSLEIGGRSRRVKKQ